MRHEACLPTGRGWMRWRSVEKGSLWGKDLDYCGTHCNHGDFASGKPKSPVVMNTDQTLRTTAAVPPLLATKTTLGWWRPSLSVLNKCSVKRERSRRDKEALATCVAGPCLHSFMFTTAEGRGGGDLNLRLLHQLCPARPTPLAVPLPAPRRWVVLIAFPDHRASALYIRGEGRTKSPFFSRRWRPCLPRRRRSPLPGTLRDIPCNTGEELYAVGSDLALMIISLR